MKKANIIILAGQSNAVGVGHTRCLSKHFDADKIKEYYDGYENVLINYYSHDKKSEGFVKTTVNCTEKSKDTLGPEVGIAEKLSRAYPGEEIFIVKCAFGGTSLYRDWLSPSGLGTAFGEYDSGAYASQKDDIIAALGTGELIRAGWCYNELVKLLSQSIENLKNNGYAPAIRAFCWMQGENDSCAQEFVDTYESRYVSLLCDLHASFGEYFDNCVYIDGGISEEWMLYHGINESKKAHAEKYENSFYIDTIAHGLTTKNEPFEEPDTYHYDSDSTLKLGWLFAEHIKL